MPITIKTAEHEAFLVDPSGRGAGFASNSAVEILDRAHTKKHGTLLQSSFDDNDFPPSISANRNGFVHSVTEAYDYHHHLIIRPDDIWIAITTQFSAYVNANAEKLRHVFVAHEGQKELVVVYPLGNRYTVDWGNFAEQMTGLIEQNILDPELRKWIVPTFTTTTWHDRITAQIVMMGTLQAYFSYRSLVLCGIPTVTLEGEKQDYEMILKRLHKLCEYGEEAADFSALLKPVIQGFIDTFSSPDSDSTKEFWAQICDVDRGSGFHYYSGWITAFCFWNTEGKRQVWDAESQVSKSRIPSGFTTVPVTIEDNGVEVLAEMLAGSVGIVSTSSGRPSAKRRIYYSSKEMKEAEEADKDTEGPVGNDTLRPRLGWFMYEKAGQTAPNSSSGGRQ